MISIGLDAHKSTYRAVAVDDAGQVCGPWSGSHSAADWTAVLQWAQGMDPERRWGIAGAWNDGRGVAQHLRGKRRLTAILYRMALTQVRAWPDAQADVARRMGAGKTKREALRALKRYLVRAIWRLWKECIPHAPGEPAARAA